MRALQSTIVGGPRTLRLMDVPPPLPSAGQALVEVRACGVNFPDALIIEDKYQLKVQRPFAPGAEIAGVVSSTAADVVGVKPGDRVIGMLVWGGMSEQVAVAASELIQIPQLMPFEEAAGFIITYGTSYHALTQRGRLKTGDRLLVLGAAGGVGLACVQLGKALGAHVTAAVSSREKLHLCIRHGADQGILYERSPLTRDAQKRLAEELKQASGGQGFDVIYDAVGGDYAEAALRSIAWQGRYLIVGFAAGSIPRVPLNLPLLKGCDILGVWWGAWLERNRQEHLGNVEQLLVMYERGLIKPHISERFPLERGGEAIEHLLSRKALGKVVVAMDSL